MLRRLAILLPILALSCAQRALDLQAAPHVAVTDPTDPTKLGMIDEQVGPIAVDDERLYWMGTQGQPADAGGSALRSCKKQDCAGSLVTYDSGEAEPATGFGVENGQIYWFRYLGTTPQGQMRWSILGCEVSGCGSGPTTVVADVLPSNEPTAYASDAIYLGLTRIPLSGNDAPLVIAANSAVALGVHDGYIYWLDEGAEPTLPLMSTLRRARTSGDSPPETLAQGVEVTAYAWVDVPTRYFTNGLAFDSGYVYWNQGTLDGAIDRCPLTGCAGGPEVVAAPIRTPLVVLSDGSKIYWLHDSQAQGFEVSSCAIGDCASPTLIASGLDGTNALTIDDQYLYTATADHAFDPNLTWDNPTVQIRRFPK